MNIGKSDRIGQKGENMNSDKNNIPLVRLGDIRKTLKTKFKVIPGSEIKFRIKIKDDFHSYRMMDHTAKVIRLYPYVVQLQLDNGTYISPGYAKLWLMLHGAA